MAARTGALSSLRLSANAVGKPGALAIASHLVARPAGPLRSIALSNNTLGAANNSLQGIPAEIGRLRGLRVLAAENCALMSVPAEIAQLARLETLRLSATC